MHTPLCRHATGEPTAYAARARELGLAEIGFSDHSPMPRDDFDNWRMRFDQLATYVAAVEEARRNHPSLLIRLGLEVDYIPGQEAWIRHLSGLHPWDYLIGSVHYVADGWAVDDPSQLSQWKHRRPIEVWTAYFKRLTAAAQSGMFDIIGHADLPKKFGIVPTEDCSPLFETFLTAAAETGVAVEFNTAGLRKDCREIYPSETFARRMHAHGIRITFGSDAHAVEEVGASLEDAVALARRVGFTQWTQFSKRQSTSIPL